MACTYKLVNRKTKEAYYGSTTDFYTRYYQLIDKESNEYNWIKHHNWKVHMHAKRGDKFDYILIEEYATIKDARKAEQKMLNKLLATNTWNTIYNVSTSASGGNLGEEVNVRRRGKKRSPEAIRKTANANRGRSHTKEHRKKISETHIRKEISKGKNNPMYGIRGKDHPSFGKPSKIAGEKHPSSKLSDNDVRTIRTLRRAKQLSQTAIAEIFGVTQKTISKIVNYETRKNI